MQPSGQTSLSSVPGGISGEKGETMMTLNREEIKSYMEEFDLTNLTEDEALEIANASSDEVDMFWKLYMLSWDKEWNR